MRAYFYQCGIWTGTDSLWHGLGLNGRIKQARSGKGPGPFVVSLAGAGGKTSTIRRLAWEAVGRGLKVLVVTTTHMARPDAFGVFDGNAEEIRTVLERRSLAVAGRPAEKGKITFTGWELYKEACSLADLVLVEADGSRQLPLKAHGPQEPVIPTASRRTICVAGASGFGRPIREAVHRPERFCTLTGAAETAPATPELAARALLAEHLCDTVFLNQLDRPEQLPAARSFAAVLSAHGIRVWGGSLRSGSIFPLE